MMSRLRLTFLYILMMTMDWVVLSLFAVFKNGLELP